MNRVTRDDTEHGVEYVRADEAQATFDNLNIVLTAWHDKTDWVQATAQPMELGMHRADVLKQRIDALKQAVADEREATINRVLQVIKELRPALVLAAFADKDKAWALDKVKESIEKLKEENT